MAATAEERIAEFIKPFRRFARRLPERGAIGIFNRSYYEELVVRVHPENLDRQKWAGQNGGQDLSLEQSAVSH